MYSSLLRSLSRQCRGERRGDGDLRLLSRLYDLLWRYRSEERSGLGDRGITFIKLTQSGGTTPRHRDQDVLKLMEVPLNSDDDFGGRPLLLMARLGGASLSERC